MKVREKIRQPALKQLASPISVPSKQPRKKIFPSPSRGWVLNENLAMTQPASARVMDNWFPLPDGARTRNGREKYQKISTTSVLSLMSYNSGGSEFFFAADETDVFDITTVSAVETIPSALIQDQTSGEYSTQQFGTSGGDFLVMVNGTDIMWQFDGSAVYPVNGAAVNTLDYDGGTVAFARGETVTGAGGANATILAVNGDATSGTLYIGPVTSGPFVDDEVLTGSVAGAAVANGINSALSSVTITGVNTDDLSFVWTFAERLFFVEKNTMSAWYLPVNAIGGAASELSLSSVFNNGGSLLFGGTWSLDSGSGLDDKCLFISTEGEIAVYEGTDPSSSTTWSKVGVYQIGRPLGFNATMKAGGDLLIATDVGLVPLSEAIKKDIGALSLASVSRPIEPAWKAGVANRGSLNWDVAKWTEKSMMLVTQPRNTATSGFPAECFVANLDTGAWARYTGWDARCFGIYGDQAYFGANDGYVWKMESTGADDGGAYTCVIVGQFDHMDMPEQTKTALQGRAHFISDSTFNHKISASIDYNVTLPTAPSAAAIPVVGGWGTGLWGSTFIWGASITRAVNSKWASIGKTGFVHAPQVQITLGDTQESDIKLISMDFTHIDGETVT